MRSCFSSAGETPAFPAGPWIKDTLD